MKTFFNLIRKIVYILIGLLVLIVVYSFYRAGIIGKWFGFDENASVNGNNANTYENSKDVTYVNYTGNTVDNLSVGNAVKSIVTWDTNTSSNTATKNFTVEEKNYDGYYNSWNFDDLILAYEGVIENQRTLSLIDVLIKDADDSLYSKPEVVFNGQSIVYDGSESYKNSLENVKNQITAEKYDVSFGYNSIRTMVNKVIITAK